MEVKDDKSGLLLELNILNASFFMQYIYWFKKKKQDKFA